MTDKEVLEYLSPIAEHPSLTGNYCKCLKIAISALRERMERNAATDINVGNKWISVEDRLPENDNDVLAFQGNGEEARIVAANYGNGVWYDCVFNVKADNITHWMPLPESPKGVKKTENGLRPCPHNATQSDCAECMKGAPNLYCCCRIECGQHEFCRGCEWKGIK